MANQTITVFVPGKIFWARGLATPDSKWGKPQYTAQLYISAETQEKLRQSGCSAKFKQDENGLSFKIKRDHQATIKGNVVEFGPPRVFMTDPAGNDVDVAPETVGNGSEVTAKLDIFDTSYGTKGTRLMALRIDNYIEYVPVETGLNDDVPF